MTKLWWEDQPHKMYVFTEEDMMVVLKILDENRGQKFGDKSKKEEEVEKVFNRILMQRLP